MRSLRLFLFMACVAVAFVANARPAYPGVLKAIQSDGTELSYHIIGDENAHAFATLDGYLICQDAEGQWVYETLDSDDNLQPTRLMAHNAELRTPEETAELVAVGSRDFKRYYETKAAARRAPLRKGESLTGFPSKGTVKGLLMLVEFSDVSFQPEYNQELYKRQMNEEGYSDYDATGSARDYFIDQSMGQFTPDIEVIGPIKLKNPEAYYGGNNAGHDGRPEEMVKEACTYAHDNLGVDFSDYDANNDGYVDFVFFIYAGYGENYGAAASTIWPHMSRLSTLNTSLTLDSKKIDLYACSCELNGKSGTEIDGIGAFCHEFSHVMGIPDMYNVSNSSASQLGSWDTMDAASYNNNSRTPSSYTAFERWSLGWLDFIDIDTPADSLSVPELTANNVAYRILTPYENEFFTIENHQQVGWDKYEAGKGMMIIHVDYNKSLWDSNNVNSGMHPCYDLEEADGSQGSHYDGDLFPYFDNNMFTDYSDPDALCWDGTPNDRGVSKITQQDDGTVSFAFMRDRLLRPVLDSPTDITNESFKASWSEVAEAIGYRLNITEILKEDENPVLLDEDFSLMKESEYPKCDYLDISSSLDDYTSTAGWTGTELYQAGGWVCLGKYGVSGSLTSPTVSLPSGCKDITVGYHASSYPGKSVNYTVKILNADTNAELSSTTFKATKVVLGQTIPVKDCPAKIKLQITTNKERVYFDDIRIVNQEVDSAGVWNIGAQSWSIDSIQGTNYTVKDLVPGRTYNYTVQALSEEPLRSSAESISQTVTLLTGSDEDGIQDVKSASEADDAIYNLQGQQLLSVPRNTIYIRKGKKYVK